MGRGDQDLADLGLFDIVFSGHEHHYDETADMGGGLRKGEKEVKEGEKAEAGALAGAGVVAGLGANGAGQQQQQQQQQPRRRNTYLSQGMARGGGVSWAKFVVDRFDGGAIVRSECGFHLIDDRYDDDAVHVPVRGPARRVIEAAGKEVGGSNNTTAGSEVAVMIEAFRARFEGIRARVLGACSGDLPNSARGGQTQQPVVATCVSPLHDAVGRACAREVLHVLGKKKEKDTEQKKEKDVVERPCMVVMNRNNLSGDGLTAGPITEGMVRDLVPFKNLPLLCEVSGAMVVAMVERQAAFVTR